MKKSPKRHVARRKLRQAQNEQALIQGDVEAAVKRNPRKERPKPEPEEE